MTTGAQCLSNTVRNEQMKDVNDINDENKRKEPQKNMKTRKKYTNEMKKKAFSTLTCCDNYASFSLFVVNYIKKRHTYGEILLNILPMFHVSLPCLAETAFGRQAFTELRSKHTRTQTCI